MSGISVKDKTMFFFLFPTTDIVHAQCISVNEFVCQRCTEPGSLELFPFSLDGLFDHSLSGTMKTTLTTFDPIHQIDLLQFRVEPLQVPA